MIQKEEQLLREHFISTFVKTLVLNSISQEEIQELRKAEQKEEERTKLREIARQLEENYAMPSIATKPENISVPKSNITQMPGNTHRTNFPQMPQGQLPQLQSYQRPKLKPGQKPETINLGRLAPMLLDPAVFSIECPGPGKNLLVNRSGLIQTAPTILSKEDIDRIMQEISEKTRIPLISGVFKAAVQDLMVTAVVSEFVGTRFVIQKRTPFQKY